MRQSQKLVPQKIHFSKNVFRFLHQIWHFSRQTKFMLWAVQYSSISTALFHFLPLNHISWKIRWSIWWSNRVFFSQFQQKMIFISLDENFHFLSTAKINPAKSFIFCQSQKLVSAKSMKFGLSIAKINFAKINPNRVDLKVINHLVEIQGFSDLICDENLHFPRFLAPKIGT